MSDRGPLNEQPMPSSFDVDEYNKKSPLVRTVEKFKNEPLIPLGCALTVWAFVNAYRAMRKGDHHEVQRMFRARVLAQGFTVVAIVGGGMYYGEERKKERELWKLQRRLGEEESRQKWIRELEARDAEEKALQERLALRRSKKAEAAAAAAAAAAAGENVNAASDKESTSVLSSLGGWIGGKTGANKEGEEAAATANKAEATTEAAATDAAAPKKEKQRAPTSSFGSLGEMFSKKGKEDSASSDESKK